MSRIKKINYAVIVALILILFIILRISLNLGLINRYQSSILNFLCINIILATSLNVTVGCLGQINLGHAGFMSIGAYAAAIFTKSGLIPGLPGYLVGLLIAGALAGLIGFLIGIPALRLKGDYLAIITLAFGEIIRVLIEFFSFTGGAQGLKSIPWMQDFTIIYFLMVCSVAFMYSLMTTRHGRAVRAIREDEIAAEASGINTTYYKTFAFIISAIFAGIAGGIYAHNIGIIVPKQFDYNYSVNILVMVVFGGMGSFTGSIISAIVLTILPEFLRSFADYRMIIYSLALILIMLFRPTGLLGRKEFSLSKVTSKIFKSKEEVKSWPKKKNLFY